MSLENIVYDFVLLASANAAYPSLFGSIVHADTYEEILEGSKWIRVGDVIQSQPQPQGEPGKVRDVNAYIEIQCVALCQTQNVTERKAARFLANEMANNLVDLIYKDRSLGDTADAVCDATIQAKRNEWRNVATYRYPVSFLVLRINPE